MRITEVGAGTIGVSWTVLLAAHGHHIVVTDPRPDLAAVVDEGVRQFAGVLGASAATGEGLGASAATGEGLGASAATGGGFPAGPDELLDHIRCEPDLATAVADADVVQEQGPERVEVKQEIFRTVGAAAPDDALLLTSTSGLMPTDIAAGLDDAVAARLVVAHPFNPPHLLPLVELVAGERTTEDTVDRAAEFLRSVGKDPVVLHREVSGFVANRLQSALFREAVHLVRSGVVSPAELDRVVTGSLGPRWATGGPFLSFHLGGGPGGLRHMLEHLGTGMARRWTSLGDPSLDEDTVAALVAGTEAAYGTSDYTALTDARDRAEVAVLAAREATGEEDS